MCDAAARRGGIVGGAIPHVTDVQTGEPEYMRWVGYAGTIQRTRSDAVAVW